MEHGCRVARPTFNAAVATGTNGLAVVQVAFTFFSHADLVTAEHLRDLFGDLKKPNIYLGFLQIGWNRMDNRMCL